MEISAEWKRRHRADLKLAVVITDYDIYPLWARPEVDLYLVPHSAQAEGLRTQGVPAERIAVTGLPIARAFEDRVDGCATRAALALFQEAPTAMLFGGGGGMGPLKEFAQVALERSSWQIVLVCGQNERLRKSLIPLAQAHPDRLRVLGYRKDVPALMQACDVVVTKAGALSLTEALYSGARVVIMPGLRGQEQANVRFMEAEGWADSCRRAKDLPALLDKGVRGRATPREGLSRDPARKAAQCLDELARRRA